MSVRPLGILLSVVLIVGAGWSLAGFSESPIEATEMRSLAHFRVEALPVNLTPQWQAELKEALAAAPEVPLLDPASLQKARRALVALPWIDPISVEAELALPDGIRVSFEPRQPRLVILHQGERVVVSRKGFVIPDGLPEISFEDIAVLPVSQATRLPEPGRRVADPLVQAALRASDEYYELAGNGALKLVGLERMPGYPESSPGVPPALAFVTHDGRRIFWGRSANMRDPLGIPLAEKWNRLDVILHDYPGLRGLKEVHLHLPKVRLVGEQGNLMTLPSLPALVE